LAALEQENNQHDGAGVGMHFIPNRIWLMGSLFFLVKYVTDWPSIISHHQSQNVSESSTITPSPPQTLMGQWFSTDSEGEGLWTEPLCVISDCISKSPIQGVTQSNLLR